MKRILFEQKNDFISIHIEIHFTEDSKIIVSGYDFGMVVQKIKGSSDYEYFITIDQKEVLKLYSKIFNEKKCKNELLLDWFEKNFNTDKAISQIRKKLTELNIKHQFSTW